MRLRYFVYKHDVVTHYIHLSSLVLPLKIMMWLSTLFRFSHPKISLNTYHTRSFLSQSYTHGPYVPPLLNQTVGAHLAFIASQYGDSIAVISSHQNTELSYQALHSKSTKLARGFWNQGIRKGDRVAVSLGNNIEYALATYALFKLGAILVPLNPSFNIRQMISALDHLEASYLIISLESNLPRKPPRSNLALLEKLVDFNHIKPFSGTVQSLRSVITVDNSCGRVNPAAFTNFVKFQDILADGSSGNTNAVIETNLNPDDIVNIQFTSGTTSAPKAACLTHKSILNNGKSIGERMNLSSKDVVCCPPPLFHCFGSVLGYLASATHGATIVFPSECFDPRATLEAIKAHGCTALHGVPTMFIDMLELIETGKIEKVGFQNLRTGIAAGSSIPPELMKRLHNVLNLTELTICYGMTETSPVSTMTTPDDPLQKKLYSVGRLLPHVQAKIVNPTNRDEILPVGHRGELAVAGYLVQKRYWNDPIRTAEVMIADSAGKIWMHTGDEAEMDKDGYVKITGRIKELIIRGGENIHPLEIENCLLGHPGIIEASVVGLPDKRYGEVVAAFIRKHNGHDELTSDDIRNWIKAELSNHLVPKYVFWMTELPKTASGKIQKFKLQERGKLLCLENYPSSES
ncbi:acyl-CoA synthetase/AMP-acid ligase-like protein II [Geopyxis carbonaria]|nr:acyl-CoA synthetase/AMP-acid ligase-like protein II [Geopyxis carbonaria]